MNTVLGIELWHRTVPPDNTPMEFYLQPPAGKWWWISEVRVRLRLTSNGTPFAHFALSHVRPSEGQETIVKELAPVGGGTLWEIGIWKNEEWMIANEDTYFKVAFEVGNTANVVHIEMVFIGNEFDATDSTSTAA